MVSITPLQFEFAVELHDIVNKYADRLDGDEILAVISGIQLTLMTKKQIAEGNIKVNSKPKSQANSGMSLK